MTTATVTIGRHWTHHRLAQNLINASHGREIGDAAREWVFVREDEQEEEEQCHCNLCNQKIKRYVLLRNTVNQNELVIGTDCYDKLYGFLTTGRIEAASLPDRREHRADLKKYWRDRIRDKTVVGWLKEQKVADTLPADIAALVHTIEYLGCAPTYTDADRVVAYYRTTRTFPVETLIGWWEVNQCRHRRFLPQQITIDGAVRLRRLLIKDSILKNRFAERLAAEKLTRDIAASRTGILAVIARVRQTLVAAGTIEASEAQATLDKVETAVTDLLPDTISSRPEFQMREMQARWKITQWKDRNVWATLQEQEVVFGSANQDHRYVLVQQDGRWVKRNVDEVLGHIANPRPGVYRAKVDDRRVFLCASIASTKIVSVAFRNPSNRDPGAYVGTWCGKVVLPSRRVTRPGYYLSFLMNEEGRYYRAWIL